MQPALVSPGPSLLGAALLLAVGSTLLARRAANVPALKGWHRWLHPWVVLTWLVALWIYAMRLLASDTLPELAARGLILAGLLAALTPLLRDVMVGLAIAIEGHLRVGDEVIIGDQEGRITHLGLRSVVIRRFDQTQHLFSNSRIAAMDVIRRDETARDSPCEWDIQLPPTVPLQEAINHLEQAVLLSPYIAPGRRPEVFVLRLDAQGPFVRVRTHVFDRRYRDEFRGDVLTRLQLSPRVTE